jgi:type I restriction enzyme S subunit
VCTSLSHYWPHDTTLWVKDFHGNEPRFVYYFFRWIALRIAAMDVGSANPTLNRNHVHPIETRWPSEMSEQRAIAHILGALDDKIELNRRMSETLEAMARALFKSWFVDFDPVRAKAEGRDPGLPKPLADLFPARLVDSELGEIPEGWRSVALGSLIEMVKGRSYKSEELIESDTALVTLKSFARGGGYRPDGLKGFAGEYKPEQIVTPGELVVACTDVTQAAEVIGRPAIVRGTRRYQTLVASLDTLIVRPRQSGVTRAFLYFLGGTEAFVAHTYAHTTGTTVLHLAKDGVSSFKFAGPSPEIIHRFDAFAARALTRLQALEEESDTLAALRDTLLPKLISGELRVRDAEKLVERAAT